MPRARIPSPFRGRREERDRWRWRPPYRRRARPGWLRDRGGAQWGIHFVIAVVVAHVLVGQREMVGRDFKRNPGFGALAPTHTLQRVRRGKMCDVQAGVGDMHRELHVALDN